MAERVRLFRPELLSEKELSLAGLLKQPRVCVSGEGTGTVVYRLELNGRDYYLKAVRAERLGKLLPRLWSARCWVSSAELESNILLDLEQRGFDTIPVVAAGTVYRWGVPVSGFMLSLSLPYPSLEEVLNDNREGVGLWKAYGELTARMLSAGCREPLRAKDVLYDVNQKKCLVLDREKPLSMRSISSSKVRRRIVERAFYRNQRSGLIIGSEALEAFYTGLNANQE